jgi:hypothetical protein
MPKKAAYEGPKTTSSTHTSTVRFCFSNILADMNQEKNDITASTNYFCFCTTSARATAAGINTFVVDFSRSLPSLSMHSSYSENRRRSSEWLLLTRKIVHTQTMAFGNSTATFQNLKLAGKLMMRATRSFIIF